MNSAQEPQYFRTRAMLQTITDNICRVLLKSPNNSCFYSGNCDFFCKVSKKWASACLLQVVHISDNLIIARPV